MTRYDKVWSNMVERLIAQVTIDIDAFVQRAIDSGMSARALERAMLDDFDNGGPIFGKFVRGLAGAAGETVVAAARQGELMGRIDGDRELSAIAKRNGVSRAVFDALNSADPEEAENAEIELADNIPEMWVAMLVNTCAQCLPLHGVIKTRQEWRELGLQPGLLHNNCKCRLVPEPVARDRSSITAPLRREKIQVAKGDPEGLRRTKRLLTNVDIDVSQAARDKALQSPEGRAMLRRLGSVNAD